MMKPVVLAAAAVAAAGLSVAAPSSAEAQYYRPGFSVHVGAPYYYGYYGYSPYRVYRPYRPYRVYGPAYAYGGPYVPACARWAWRYNRYGERRRYCLDW